MYYNHGQSTNNVAITARITITALVCWTTAAAGLTRPAHVTLLRPAPAQPPNKLSSMWPNGLCGHFPIMGPVNLKHTNVQQFLDMQAEYVWSNKKYELFR